MMDDSGWPMTMTAVAVADRAGWEIGQIYKAMRPMADSGLIELAGSDPRLGLGLKLCLLWRPGPKGLRVLGLPRPTRLAAVRLVLNDARKGVRPLAESGYQPLLRALKNEPGQRARELAAAVGSVSAKEVVARLMRLRRRGLVERRIDAIGDRRWWPTVVVP
jgi:DNA-binding IclR family transcriptional regulator